MPRCRQTPHCTISLPLHWTHLLLLKIQHKHLGLMECLRDCTSGIRLKSARRASKEVEKGKVKVVNYMYSHYGMV